MQQQMREMMRSTMQVWTRQLLDDLSKPSPFTHIPLGKAVYTWKVGPTSDT